MAMTPEQLLEHLERIGIKTQTLEHEAVFTVEESEHLKDAIPGGGHTKNLFVKDRKGNFFLIVAEGNALIPLNRIHEKIGAKSRLSFAKTEALMELLGIEAGSVSAFAAINDDQGKVKLVIDESLLAHDSIHCHPLTNRMTTTILKEDLLRFLRQCGHEPLVAALSETQDKERKK